MTRSPGRRAVFVDIDGTLLTEQGQVPDSARIAIATARARGHLVFLATGRSRNEIPDDVLSIGFDGVIAASGGYIALADGRILADRLLDPDAAHRALTLLSTLDVDHFVQAPGGLSGSPAVASTLRRLYAASTSGTHATGTGRADLDTFLTGIAAPTPSQVPVEADKIVFLAAGDHLQQIHDELAGSLTVAPPSVPWFGPDSGELTAPGIHKGWAASLVLDALAIPASASIAFGDSANDLELLQTVAIGIAMADGSPRALAAASQSTEPARDDGIAKAFARLGLADRRPTEPGADVLEAVTAVPGGRERGGDPSAGAARTMRA